MDHTFVVTDPLAETASPLAQRLLVWARHDKRVKVSHRYDGRMVFLVPDDLVKAAASGGYGNAIQMSATNTVTVTQGQPAPVGPQVGQVTGIDPNDNTTVKAAPSGFTVKTAAARPGEVTLTWTHDQRHTAYALRYRRSTPAGQPATEIQIPGYKRQHVLTGLANNQVYIVSLQALVASDGYVPVWSEMTMELPAIPGQDQAPPATISMSCSGTTVSLSVDTLGGGPAVIAGGFTGSPITNPGTGGFSDLVYPGGTTGVQNFTITYSGYTANVQTSVLPCP